MKRPVVLLSVPGLRQTDLERMGQLQHLTAGGETAELIPSFPCVTCPVQANMTTGKTPREHGVVANGFYWRDQDRVEMWTSPADCIAGPQIWDSLRHRQAPLTSAVWFPLHSKQSHAEFVCTPAPIHNPDGSESLWCYTRPTELYGLLRDTLGDFPLKNFWGPMAGVESTAWIVDSAACAADAWRPDFFYVYLPHLDYAAQRDGPNSEAAQAAVAELDELIGRLGDGFEDAYDEEPLYLVAGEYAITDVDHVSYPNRTLREAGLLAVRESDDGGETLDTAASRAFALVDHQFSHVFTDGAPDTIKKVAELFTGAVGIDQVLLGDQLADVGLDHERSGEIVLVSTPNSWQAYYWWLSDDKAPAFARTVDIHRKPGYDPVELHFDRDAGCIPLDATLVRGSHGAPSVDPSQRTVIASNATGLLPQERPMFDTEVFDVVMRHFGE